MQILVTISLQQQDQRRVTLVVIIFFILLDEVSLCSHDWLCTRYIDQAFLKLKRSIYLPQPSLQKLEAHATITCLTMVFSSSKPDVYFIKNKRSPKQNPLALVPDCTSNFILNCIALPIFLCHLDIIRAAIINERSWC